MTTQATEKQISYIRDLYDRKNLYADTEIFDMTNAMDDGEFDAWRQAQRRHAATLSRHDASALIDRLRNLPDSKEYGRPTPRQEPRDDTDRQGDASRDLAVAASYARITGEDGKEYWGVKLDGYRSPGNTPMTGHSGRTVHVRKRDETTDTVVLGAQVMQANGGRSAWYEIAQQGRSARRPSTSDDAISLDDMEMDALNRTGY